MKNIILLFLFLFSVITYAQEKKVWYNQINVPPSPNAAALGKYGDYSIGKSTGAIDVSIPIITIEEGGISVPISLSYQTSGLKVEDKPSWVGLGWSLFSGGVITRSSRGLPDDHDYGFLRNLTDIPNSVTIDNDLTLPVLRTKVYEQLTRLSENGMDYEPDLFSYNFGSNAGSFSFGNDGNIHCEQFNALKFSPIYGVDDYENSNVIVGWRVIDDMGVLYIFKAMEYSFVNVRGVDIPTYASSWYLTSIENPLTGKSITFEYESYNFSPTNTSSLTQVYERTTSSQWIRTSNSVSPSTSYLYKTKFLSRILFPNQEVSFVSSPSEDSFRKLESIIWKNKNTQRKFSFSYSYFSACSNGGDCYRLKLTSVEEFNLEDPKRHVFEYNDGSFPKKQSFAQDHWGYYNGAASNNSLVPNVSYSARTFGDGADREPKYSTTLLGTLSKITYPTKGFTEFRYQQNTTAGVKTIEEVRRSTTKNIAIAGENFRDKRCTTTSIHLTDADLESTARTSGSPLVHSLTYQYYLEILDVNNYDPVRNLGELTVRDVTAGVDLKPVFTFKNTAYVLVTIPSTELVNGHQYQFNLCAYGSSVKSHVLITHYTYNPDDVGAPVGRPTGGVRIAEIKNYDPENKATHFKTFDYGYGGYAVAGSPLYYSPFTYRRYDATGAIEEVPRLLVHSSSVGGVGSPVAYQTVTEYLGTASANQGKIVTTFLYAKDVGHRNFPYPPQISQQAKRSKVKLQQYFSASGDLVKDEIFEYDLKVTGSIKGFKVSKVQESETGLAPDFTHAFTHENFTLYSTWHKLIRKVEKNYLANGNTENATAYFYESTLHPYPTREVTTDAKGQSLTFAFKYSLDYTACPNNCYDQYVTSLSACNSASIKHSTEVNNCALIYGQCYNQFFTCMQAKDQDIDSNCKAGGTLSIPCAARKNKDWKCETKFSNCSNSTYVPCLSALQDQYMLCQKKTFNDFKLCQLAHNDCLLNEYETTASLPDKAIDLLTVSNQRSVPIEIRELRSDSEIAKKSIIYGIWPGEKALQSSATIAYRQGVANPVVTFKQYDGSANATEVEDAKDGFSKSYVWGHRNTYVIAQATKAAANQIAFTSFEEDSNEGNWSFQFTPSSQNKTGYKSHLLNGRSITKAGLNASGKYVVSFWAKGGIPTINNVVATYDDIQDEADGWRYYHKVISGTTTITISGGVSTVIDELRLYPEGASMTTFCYEPGIGLMSSTDVNNRITYFQYDKMGRLKGIDDHKHHLLKLFQYNFKDN